jgi:hypothetical protein
MQTLAAFLVDDHIKDLERTADGLRLGREDRSRRSAAWRRRAAGTVRRVSIALEEVATQLDQRPGRASYGRE